MRDTHRVPSLRPDRRSALSAVVLAASALVCLTWIVFLSSMSGDEQEARRSDLAPATLDRAESPSKTCPPKCRHPARFQSSLTGFRHARILQSAWNRQRDAQDETAAGQHLAGMQAIGGGAADPCRLFIPKTTLPVTILVIGHAPSRVTLTQALILVLSTLSPLHASIPPVSFLPLHLRSRSQGLFLIILSLLL